MDELQGNFTLNKIGYYTPAIVEENKWLNDKQKPEDIAKYGKNWAVVFEGDAATYLWTAKNAPEVGKQYWGHLQATSGKSIRFKTDKFEESMTSSSPTKNQPQGSYEAHSHDKDDSIARAVALKAAVEYWAIFPDTNPAPEMVEQVADRFLGWLQNSGAQPKDGQGTQPPRVQQEATSAAPTAGYDKAKQAREQLNQDPEVQSLMDFADNQGEDDDYNN